MSEIPFLNAWFDIMDSDTPERALDLITDDFQLSIQFSQGDGVATEFSGDRDGFESYLNQRAKHVRVHEVIAASRVGDIEMVLGKVTQAGDFEASFNATAEIDVVTNKARRLLVCRTPEVEF
jgi:hypothetical protein